MRHDLAAVGALVDAADDVIAAAIARLRELGGPDASQVLAYDLAHVGVGGRDGPGAARLRRQAATPRRPSPCAFAADTVHDLITRVTGREALWGATPGRSTPIARPSPATATPTFAVHAGRDIRRRATSTTTWRWCRTRSAPSPPTSSRPTPSTCTARTATSRRTVIAGLAEIGAFGLSVPADVRRLHRGWRQRVPRAWSIATEELSRASLGIGGSLITRPEILTRALVKGGTEAQKQEWLPKLATAEAMVGRRRHRTRLRQRRRRPQGHRHAGAGAGGEAGLRDQRGEDVVHVRRPRRRADAARPHRPRPHARAPRAQPVHRPQAAGRRPRLRVHPGSGRRARSARWRAGRSTRSATAACTATRSRSRTGGCRRTTCRRRGRARPRLLLPDGGVRERPAADRSAGRSGVMQAAYEAALDYARNRTVFGAEHRRLPADPGQARADGGADPGGAPVLVPRRHG